MMKIERSLPFGSPGAGIVLGLVCLACVDCSSTQTRVYTMQPGASTPATWNGRDVDEVIEVWGPPSARQSDGEGGALLVYDEKTAVSASASGGPPTPPDLDPNSREGMKATQEVRRTRAQFWVGADGTVYRFWFSADVYGKGLDTPPARKTSKPEAEGLAVEGGP